MVMKVTESSPESVRVWIRGGTHVDGESYTVSDDYTVETKDGMTLHLGKCFIVGNHIVPASVVEKVTARQMEVRDVVVYGLQPNRHKRPEEE